MSDSRVRELWGKKFDVVDEGLDESQVEDFVDELIKERDTLLEQRNSLLSYIRLTKSMVGKEGEIPGDSGQQANDRVARVVTGVGQDIQPEVETTELEQETQSVLLEATGAAESGREDPFLYQGELELAVLPPVDADELLQFERRLRDSFQLKILSIDGSPSKGCLLVVFLNEPQPLLKGLKRMPQVKEAVEELDTQAKEIFPSRFRNRHGRIICVTLDRGLDKRMWQ